MLRYRYRGNNPNHPDNVGLREAMRRRVPLIYFHGIVEGKYEAEYPVFIVGDSPESLTFTVTVDERRFTSLGNVARMTRSKPTFVGAMSHGRCSNGCTSRSSESG